MIQAITPFGRSVLDRRPRAGSKIAYADLLALSQGEQEHLTSLVAEFATAAKNATVAPDATFGLDDLVEAQRLIREVFENAVSRRVGAVALQPVALAMYLGPRPAVQEPAPTVLWWNFQTKVPTLVVLAALTRLERLRRPSLVRRCPYRIARPDTDQPDAAGSGVCGRVFVGRARQKWCVEHLAVAKRNRDRSAQEERRKRRREEQQPGKTKKEGTEPREN